MGCGGSRADTIEPRYYESWTRETESTWLTNTDTEIGQAIASNINNNQRGISDTGSASVKQCSTTCLGKGEDARAPGHGTSGAPGREKKLVNTATQCGKPPVHASSGGSGSRGRALHRDESKPKPRKVSTKEAATSKSALHCPEGNPCDGK